LLTGWKYLDLAVRMAANQKKKPLIGSGRIEDAIECNEAK
jgi:hypothetical protein